MRLLFASLVIIMLASPVVGHELSVYTVIVNNDGAHPANIPNGSLKEGDSAWFWMKDSTDNATLIVEIERDGATMRSPILQFECELDENGTLVDDECKNRYDHVFNQHNSAGLWNLTFLKFVNGELNQTYNGSVYIEEDLHDSQEDEQVIIDSKEEIELLSKQNVAAVIAVISLVSIALILTSMGDDSTISKKGLFSDSEEE